MAAIGFDHFLEWFESGHMPRSGLGKVPIRQQGKHPVNICMCERGADPQGETTGGVRNPAGADDVLLTAAAAEPGTQSASAGSTMSGGLLTRA